MDLLLGAARRCWWTDPGRDARMLVAATATRLAGDQSHPTLQSVLAFAAPDAHGGGGPREPRPPVARPGLDAVQLTHLGIAATILGAFEQVPACCSRRPSPSCASRAGSGCWYGR